MRSLVEQRYQEREQARKRRAAKVRLWVCPPITLFLGWQAWTCFQTSNTLMTVVYAAGALFWVALFVYGWIVDRPEKEVK